MGLHRDGRDNIRLVLGYYPVNHWVLGNHVRASQFLRKQIPSAVAGSGPSYVQ
jgi:hypothetical protein